MDAHGSIIVRSEYGAKLGPDGAMCRYAYLSEDYGQTWRTIFELVTDTPTGGVDRHHHGSGYDPFRDAIWLIQGENAGRGLWVCYDRGRSWTRVPDQGKQFTSVIALPECIPLGSDITPDGIYRIPRTSRDALPVELAHPVGSAAGIDIVSSSFFRSRSMRDAPVVCALGSAADPNPGRRLVTYDGYTLRQVHVDTQAYLDRGLQTLVGPTVANQLQDSLCEAVAAE